MSEAVVENTKTNTPLKPTTAIIPIAGMGSRMYPFTLETNKSFLSVGSAEMLITAAVREAVLSGMEKIVLVTNPKEIVNEQGETVKVNEPAPDIVRFFTDKLPKYMNSEESKHANNPVLQDIKTWLPDLLENDKLIFAPQLKPDGLGHAIYQGLDQVPEKEPFAVLLPDDYIENGRGELALPQMVQDYKKGSVVAAMDIPGKDIEKFGAFELASEKIEIGQKAIPALGMVEKSKTPPSHKAAIGRYIAAPEVKALLQADVEKGRVNGKEIDFTKPLNKAARELEIPLTAYEFDGHRYDFGNHKGKRDGDIGVALQQSLENNVFDYPPHVIARMAEVVEKQLAQQADKVNEAFYNKAAKWVNKVEDIGVAESKVQLAG